MAHIGRIVIALVVIICIGGVLGCAVSGGTGGNGLIVTPSSTTLQPGGTRSFSANVSVAWSVLEADGGYISNSGLYVAPGVAGTYHVVATSMDGSKTVSAKVIVSSSGSVSGLVAAPMADAATMNYPKGATLVRWPSMGIRVMAYLLYRDTNQSAPIAVLDGSTTFYIDSATPLPSPDDMMEDTQVSIQLDQNTGFLENFDFTTTYAQSLDDLKNPEMQFTNASLDITCHRVPLKAGETCGYQLRVLFVEYDPGSLTDPLQHPAEYRLYLGNKGGTSNRIALTEPPTLTVPADQLQPLDDNYSCTRVPGALLYTLQISTDPVFLPGRTQTVAARVDSDQYVVGEFPYTQLWTAFPAAGQRIIYWRMGARIAGQALPVALTDTVQNGWVYSTPNIFQLPEFPPPGP